MIDYTLKFTSEDAANSILESLTDCSIDIIGVIYKDDAPIDGWHVNVRGPHHDILDEYAVLVKTPIRVWM